MEEKKKILFISDSELDAEDETKDICTRLGNFYEVNHCQFSYEIITVSMKEYGPELIIIYMNGTDREKLKGIVEVKKHREYSNVKVLIIGKMLECVLYDSVVPVAADKILIRPVEMRVLIREATALLYPDREVPEDIEEKMLNFQRKKVVLAVDDDIRMLKLIENYLKNIYKVICIRDAKDALHFVKKKQPDLLLLDYMMPKVNGPELLSRIREIPNGKNLPVIFLTGVSERSKVLECLQLNVSDYVLKPVSKNELLEKIHKIWQME